MRDLASTSARLVNYQIASTPRGHPVLTTYKGEGFELDLDQDWTLEAGDDGCDELLTFTSQKHSAILSIWGVRINTKDRDIYHLLAGSHAEVIFGIDRATSVTGGHLEAGNPEFRDDPGSRGEPGCLAFSLAVGRYEVRNTAMVVVTHMRTRAMVVARVYSDEISPEDCLKIWTTAGAALFFEEPV